MAQVQGPIHANSEVLGFYHKQKSEFHFTEKTDNEFLMFLLDTAVRVISIVQHLAPVIEAVSDASADAVDEIDELDETSNSEYRGGTGTMDVEELNSINREVDEIIQLPPEPNPPPAIRASQQMQQHQHLHQQTVQPAPVSTQPIIPQQPVTTQQVTAQPRTPASVPVQIPASTAQYSTHIAASSIPVSLSVSETPAAVHPAPAPQSSSQPTASSSTAIPEPTYSQFAPAPETDNNSMAEVKPEAVPEVVTIKDEVVEPMQITGTTDSSQLLPQSTLNQLMNTLQSNEENIGVANLVTTAQPSSLSSTFLDKSNNPLSMLSLSNTTSSINTLFPGKGGVGASTDSMPGSSRGGELKSLMDNKAGGSANPNTKLPTYRSHRNDRHTMANLDLLHREYHQLHMLSKLKGGLSHACKLMGISRSSWYLRRHITELCALDFELYNKELGLAMERKLHIRAFNEICKRHIESSKLSGAYCEMQSSGLLL